jgi:hypothetical protein
MTRREFVTLLGGARAAAGSDLSYYGKPQTDERVISAFTRVFDARFCPRIKLARGSFQRCMLVRQAAHLG